MPTTQEKNQFRRLVGDFGTNKIDDTELDAYLDDATWEITADFVDANRNPAPIDDFDDLSAQYKPEIIYYAAIQWWWNKLSKYTEQHSQTVGSASQNQGERWDRAYQMIQTLKERYDAIQILGVDITFGNLSYFSKRSLTRVGGRSEEQTLEDA